MKPEIHDQSPLSESFLFEKLTEKQRLEATFRTQFFLLYQENQKRPHPETIEFVFAKAKVASSYRPSWCRATLYNVVKHGKDLEQAGTPITPMSMLPRNIRLFQSAPFLPEGITMDAFRNALEGVGLQAKPKRDQILAEIERLMPDRTYHRPAGPGRKWKNGHPSLKTKRLNLSHFKRDFFLIQKRFMDKRQRVFEAAALNLGFQWIRNPAPFQVFILDSTPLIPNKARGTRKPSPWLTSISDACTGTLMAGIVHDHAPDINVALETLKRAMLPWHLLADRVIVPEYLQVDQGANHMSANVRLVAESLGIKLNKVPKSCPAINGRHENTNEKTKCGLNTADPQLTQAIMELWKSKKEMDALESETDLLEKAWVVQTLATEISRRFDVLNRTTFSRRLGNYRKTFLDEYLKDGGTYRTLPVEEVHRRCVELKQYSVNNGYINLGFATLKAPPGLSPKEKVTLIAAPEDFRRGDLGDGAIGHVGSQGMIFLRTTQTDPRPRQDYQKRVPFDAELYKNGGQAVISTLRNTRRMMSEEPIPAPGATENAVLAETENFDEVVARAFSKEAK